jgi:hypothetical protein
MPAADRGNEKPDGARAVLPLTSMAARTPTATHSYRPNFMAVFLVLPCSACGENEAIGSESDAGGQPEAAGMDRSATDANFGGSTADATPDASAEAGANDAAVDVDANAMDGQPDAPVKMGCRSGPWTSEVVAAAGHILELDVDESNRVHIAYNTTGATRIATRSGTEWTEIVAPVQAANVGFNPRTGTPHLCLAGQHLVRRDNDWQTTAMPAIPCGPGGVDCSLGGFESAAYYDLCAIAVEADDDWMALWLIEDFGSTDEGYTPMVRISGPELSWSLTPEMSSYWLGRVEIALDRSRTLHAMVSHAAGVYLSIAADGALSGFQAFACGSGYGTWPGCKALGAYGAADVAVAQDGTVYVAAPGTPMVRECELSEQQSAMTLFTRTAGGWTQQMLAPVGRSGGGEFCVRWSVAPSIAVTPSGEPVVCWVQPEPDDGSWEPSPSGPVRCAWRADNQPTVTTIVERASRGKQPPFAALRPTNDYPQLELDIAPNGCCHAAYIDPEGAVRRATDCP